MCAIAIWPRMQSTTKGCAFLIVLVPGRRITRVPNRARALQSCQFFLTKHLRHQTHVFVHEKARARAVAGDNAGAFLSAMLQREQAVVRQHCRVRMPEHAEKAALVLRQQSRSRAFPLRQVCLRGNSHEIIHQIGIYSIAPFGIHKLGMLSSCSTARSNRVQPIVVKIARSASEIFFHSFESATRSPPTLPSLLKWNIAFDARWRCLLEICQAPPK